MKYLYLATTELEGYCDPKSETFGDFIFNKKRIYCTKLEVPHSNNIRFEFILMTYNISTLLVNITHYQIPMFLAWRQRYFPQGIRSIVNIYNTKDICDSLYCLEADTDLSITCHFFEEFIPVLTSITTRTH